MESFKIAKILATSVLFYSFGSRWLFSYSALPTVHNMLLLLNFLPITTFLILVHLFLSVFLFFFSISEHMRLQKAQLQPTSYLHVPQHAARAASFHGMWHACHWSVKYSTSWLLSCGTLLQRDWNMTHFPLH